MTNRPGPNADDPPGGAQPLMAGAQVALERQLAGRRTAVLLGAVIHYGRGFDRGLDERADVHAGDTIAVVRVVRVEPVLDRGSAWSVTALTAVYRLDPAGG